jgi:hypothetical protein
MHEGWLLQARMARRWHACAKHLGGQGTGVPTTGQPIQGGICAWPARQAHLGQRAFQLVVGKVEGEGGVDLQGMAWRWACWLALLR